MHINLSASLQSRREAFHLPSNSLPFHLYFMLDVQFLGVGCTFSIIAFNFIVNLRHAHVQLTVGECILINIFLSNRNQSKAVHCQASPLKTKWEYSNL